MPKFVAVDGIFIDDLINGCRISEEILFSSRLVGHMVVTLPTAAHEILDAFRHDKSRDLMQTLQIVSTDPKSFGNVLYPTLDPFRMDPSEIAVKNGLAQIAANELIERSILNEPSRNLALMIGEAAVMPAEIFILDDFTLKSFSHRDVNKVLSERELSPIVFATKESYLEAYRA